jgi:3',5'-cyclic AMP phosphodiesterase CpdA
MTKFLHISDLHIHKCYEKNTDVTLLFDYISKNYPEHKIIITGDITDDGDKIQYENAYEYLKPFEGRLFICPGNHDYGIMGNIYSADRAQMFDEYLSMPLKQNGCFKGCTTPIINTIIDGDSKIDLIALDSNLETSIPFDFACGEIGEQQLDFLREYFKEKNNRVKIIFFHHHPFIIDDPFMKLRDAEELVRIIYNNVDVVLFGHKHVMWSWEKIWGSKHVLASDNSPGKYCAKEIVVDGLYITVNTAGILS